MTPEAAMQERVKGHTPTPWSYRPQEHDDWGVIRGPLDDEGFRPIAAVARANLLAEHRRNKTDPAYANAALIVEAVNSHAELIARQEALVKALTELVRQVRISGAFDDHGHAMTNLKALSDADAALARASQPIPQGGG